MNTEVFVALQDILNSSDVVIEYLVSHDVFVFFTL